MRSKKVSGKHNCEELEEGCKRRLELEDEGNCPICQMELCEGDELTWCRKGCGHNVHADCMKMWAEHKKCGNAAVVCPLCRSDWGNYALGSIADDKKQSTKKNKSITHLGYKCNSCKTSNIAGER